MIFEERLQFTNQRGMMVMPNKAKYWKGFLFLPKGVVYPFVIVICFEFVKNATPLGWQ